jgi:hypothetical protein
MTIRLLEAEATLLQAVPSEGSLPDEVCEALGRLLDELLWSLDPSGAPATDGLILRREAAYPSGFWALGNVYMLPPSEEPLWAEFAFSPSRDSIVSARILFGVRDDELKGMRRTKLADKLFGYPLEVVTTVPWRYEFARRDFGWTRLASDARRQGPRGSPTRS